MNSVVKLPKYTILGSITKVDNADNIQSIYSLKDHNVKANVKAQPLKPLLPVCPNHSSFTTHAHNINKSPMQLQDANVPSEIEHKLHAMLTSKLPGIISRTPTDFGRTNLIEMDLHTTGPPVSTKPYTIPLKYKSFSMMKSSSWKMLAAFASHLVIGHVSYALERRSQTQVKQTKPNSACVLTTGKSINP